MERHQVHNDDALSSSQQNSQSNASQTPNYQFIETSIDVGFWIELRRRKLDVWRLDDSGQDIVGFLQLSYSHDVPTTLHLRRESFEWPEGWRRLSDTMSSPDGEKTELPVTEASSALAQCGIHEIPVPGQLVNVNTLKHFKLMDKRKLLEEHGQIIWEDIKTGHAAASPHRTMRFVCLTFADLLSHRHVYWFGLPTLQLEKDVRIIERNHASKFVKSDQLTHIHDQLLESRREFGSFPLTFALVFSEVSGLWSQYSLAQLVQEYQPVQLIQLAQNKQLLFAVMDSCGHAQNSAFGWTFRNAAAMIARHFDMHGEIVHFLLYRTDRRGRPRLAESGSAVNEAMSSVIEVVSLQLFERGHLNDHNDAQFVSTSPGRLVAGWQMNRRGRPGPRVADMSAIMSEQKLSRDSVLLNLSLMRWRQAPSLDLDLIKDTKCLLIGAGTLGCNVARVMMGWGFKYITFLDRGHVSYSNPARQPLYEFADCARGPPKLKIDAATAALRRISPDVEAKGARLSIPMPGHCATAAELDEALEDARKMEELITEANLVFLLTDTRESRWLPTMLCTCWNKPLINVALGFDSFLVMRHNTQGAAHSDPRLGCYFCSDVVAPTNSERNQTLDQQCTVTRPGLAPIASAMAVELAINCLHHPAGFAAPASKSVPPSEPTEEPLGLLPHQIRGFMAHFSTMVLEAEAFDKCTACSSHVTDAYKRDGKLFLAKALQSPVEFLEELTGLAKLKAELNDYDFDWVEDE